MTFSFLFKLDYYAYEVLNFTRGEILQQERGVRQRELALWGTALAVPKA